VTLPVYRYADADDRQRIDALMGRLREQASGGGDVASDVAAIIDQVRQRGDEAVVDYMRQWTDPDFTADRIKVSQAELDAAAKSLDPKLREALLAAIANVRTYQQHVMPAEPLPLENDGAVLGMKFTPLRRVGLAVPGGTASYPSTVIMNAVPAQVAGVSELAVVCPPPTGGGGDISPLVLAACRLLGISEVYRIGGAQAMAALALGTDTVPAVDFIAGPGNAYVQQAKRQLFGTVGIDGFYGPSEVVVLADASADPVMLAADLLAQAEHDPGCCFLVSSDPAVIEAIAAEVQSQLPDRARKDAIVQALTDWSAAIIADNDKQAVAIVDELAGEHVTLAVKDPNKALRQIRNGGAFFLGDRTPVASGDYYAGPSHCLPTGTTARFTSGISVFTFLKRSSVEQYPMGPGPMAIDHIVALAEAEGLDAHAESVRKRRTD
jgi:histidinol dehydrogenase